MTTPPIRDAFDDWGNDCRSVSFLLTGNPLAIEMAWEDLAFPESFGRRKRTTRLRLFLPPGEGRIDTVARLIAVGNAHDVSVELLHGAGDSEWYELLHMGTHGKRWGKEETPS